MAPGIKGFKLPVVIACLAVLGLVRDVEGSGHIEVHFLRYTDNCYEDFRTSKCDPMFSFCLSTPQTESLSVSNCNYASTGETSDHYQNTNDIILEHLTSILGQPNPWVVLVNAFVEPSVMLVIRARDHDYIEHDHMQTWGTTLKETVWPTKEQSLWVEHSMTSNSHTMHFRIRMYCDPFYYTSKCDVYCKPQDASTGHYTCDSSVGRKICLPGWQGPQCAEDIDECALAYCINGECTNLPGDYSCNCTINYMGKNCSMLMNPCRSLPCQNGGTCFAHASEHVYICQCTQNWEGEHCETKKDPCKSNPCQNNGSCASSPDERSYNCTCAYPYNGANCEAVSTSLETTLPSTATTLPTTTLFTTTKFTTTMPNTTVPDTPETTLAPTKMTEGIVSTLPEGFHDENVQQFKQKDDDSNFQMWYIAIIVAALLIVVLVLAVVFFRRRKNKACQHEIMQPSLNVSFDGSQLAFENSMYNSTNRNNFEIETQTRQLPPVPTNTIDEEMFDQIKLSFVEVDETEGATGGLKDDNSELKTTLPANLEKDSSPVLGSLARPLSERAPTNPYADFKSLRESQTAVKYPDESNTDEGHYHDLDEIAAFVMRDQHEDSSDGAFNYAIQETPVVIVLGSPYDFPSNNSSIYATPRTTTLGAVHNGEEFKDVTGLTKNNAPTNMLAPRTTDAALYRDDSSDDDIAQEDLAQLRKTVEKNMKPFNSGKA